MSVPYGIQDYTPRKRSRGRGLVGMVALIGGLTMVLVVVIGGVQWATEQPPSPGPRTSWADLQVAQARLWAVTAGAIIEQRRDLARAQRRIDHLCATLDVLVGMTPGRARLPRVVEDACDPPLPAVTSRMRWGGR